MVTKTNTKLKQDEFKYNSSTEDINRVIAERSYYYKAEKRGFAAGHEKEIEKQNFYRFRA